MSTPPQLSCTHAVVQASALPPALLTPKRLNALLCEIRLQREYAEGQFPIGMPHSQLGQADYMRAALGGALAVLVLDLGGQAAGEAVLSALGLPEDQLPELMQLLVTSRYPQEG